MSQNEMLIEKIMSACGIVGRHRRSDIAREMRSHIEDIIEEERKAGCDEKEIERLVALRFGRPEEIADEFATVYRSQRIGMTLLSYSLLAILSTLAVAAFVYSVQYGVFHWVGLSTEKVFSRSHISAETIMLGSLTFGYLAVYFAERLFKQKRLIKALGLVGITFVTIGSFLEFVGVAAIMSIVAGFLFAAFVRTVETIFVRYAFRVVGILVFFATVAIAETYLMTVPGRTPVWFLFLPAYLAIAVSSQFVVYFAGLFDREILNKHFA